MTFLMPYGLIGLVGVPILILVYILKHRYREETVPSTFLWRRSLKYKKHQLPFSLRNSILLLLQILAIVAASFLLARPAVTSHKTGEKIVILDGSASMAALDANDTARFDRAKTEILSLAEDADANHRMTVIYAGETASYAVYRSAVKSEIVDAVSSLSCGGGNCDIENALLLAEKTQEDNTEAEIRFYTDTKYDSVNGVTVMDMSHREWNAAALGLTAQLSGGVIKFTGTIASYGEDAKLTASLYVNGTLASIKQVECVDGEETKVEFRDYEATKYTYAELIVTCSENREALENDNSYTLYAGNSSSFDSATMRVELVRAPGVNDSFLLLAIRASENVMGVRDVQLTEGDVEDGREIHGTAEEGKVRYSGYGAYIFVGVLPNVMPEDGAVWLINPPEIPEGIPVTCGETTIVSDPQNTGIAAAPGLSEEHAKILQGMTYQNTKVKTYMPQHIEDTASFSPLITCEGNTVVSVGKLGFTRVVLWTLGDSDFQANLADYPMLIRGLLAYSYPAVFPKTALTVGEEAKITMPPGAEKVEIYCNGEQETVLDAADTSYMFHRPGDWEVRIIAKRTGESGLTEEKALSYYCFVSVDAAESNLYPVEEELSAIPLPENYPKSVFEPTEIWVWFLVALLVILTAEWWVYYRV